MANKYASPYGTAEEMERGGVIAPSNAVCDASCTRGGRIEDAASGLPSKTRFCTGWCPRQRNTGGVVTGLDGRGPSSIRSSRRCKSEAFALGRATYGRRLNVPTPPTLTLSKAME